MTNINTITFRRTDFSIPSHVEESAKEVADHFKVRRNYVPQFCMMIKTSKRWKVDEIESNLERWKSFFCRLPGTRKIIEIIERAFLNCTQQDDINHLRGALVEALIIGCHGGSTVLSKSNYGWGAKVTINTPNQVIKVRYNCVEHQCDNCSSRATVDFGVWTGKHGKFFECKAQPIGIGCKEIKYMQELKAKLNEISHEVFFVCAESRESIKMRLEELGLGPLYKPFGIEDIKELMPA